MSSKSFFQKALTETVGIFTSRGAAAWAVAGVVAYTYFVVPQQREQREAMLSRERARRRALERGDLETERRTGGGQS